MGILEGHCLGVPGGIVDQDQNIAVVRCHRGQRPCDVNPNPLKGYGHYGHQFLQLHELTLRTGSEIMLHLGLDH